MMRLVGRNHRAASLIESATLPFHIHSEQLKKIAFDPAICTSSPAMRSVLGVAESTVLKYMIQRRGPPSQSWRTLLRNHVDAIAAVDLCVVPTLTFERLFAFLVLGHGRRQLRGLR
jgi:hypothetical protein